MIKPKAFKKVCENCGFSKLVKPKSDALSAADLMPFKCPKCGAKFQIKELNAVDKMLSLFKFRT